MITSLLAERDSPILLLNAESNLALGAHLARLNGDRTARGTCWHIGDQQPLIEDLSARCGCLIYRDQGLTRHETAAEDKDESTHGPLIRPDSVDGDTLRDRAELGGADGLRDSFGWRTGARLHR